MNKKEKLVIEQLDRNAKVKINELAKKLLISKQACYNIIKSLEKKGIIKGYITVIDTYRLGANNVYIFLEIRGLSSEEMKKRQNKLKEIEALTSITNLFGDYDLGISVYFRDLIELSHILNKIDFIFGKSIEKKSIHLTKSHIVQSMVFEDKKDRISFKREIVKDFIKITPLEKKILELIGFNSRLNYIDIGEHLGVSPNTVKYHIKKLENEKVILGCKTLLDYSKLGYLWNICKLEIFPGKKIEPILEYFKNNKKIPFLTVDLDNNIQFDYLSEDYASLKEFLRDLKVKYNPVIKKYTLLNINTLTRNGEL
jgi:Lrp/AsnC family leucine-responsive transcriptional regulator